MNKKLLDALESSLHRMEQGEPLDAALARYPDLASQLRPLLETAARARSTRQEEPAHDRSGAPACAWSGHGG